MKEIRKYLHRNPELSGKEKETSAFIAGRLRELGIEKTDNHFSGHSVLAEIDSPIPGKTLLFRCELDALPIEEINKFSHRSLKKGISHKCGHDGHMVIMLGLAEKLMEKSLPGKFLLLFQSSEENGKGAKAILRCGKLDQYDIDHIFSLHNIPGIPMGEIICRPGNFTAYVESLDIRLKGKTSHAGMPEGGINPAEVLPEIIDYFKSVHNPKSGNGDYFLATPIQVRLGKPAYGISAGDALVSYTFRSWDKAFFEGKKTEIIIGLERILEKTSLELSFKWKLAFDANVNDREAFEIICEAAGKNAYPLREMHQPFSFGEDFGSLTQKYRGAMFGLGAGEGTPELHNPDYDFPDEIHQAGVGMFLEIAKIASGRR